MKKHLIRVLSLLLAVALLLPLLSGTAVSATRTTSERAPKFKSYLTTGYNSAAITENGDLYMWGENSAGEVGNNTTEIQLTPTKVLSDVIFVDLCRSYRGLSNNYDTVAAITENGDLYMWGGNSSGEVGNGLNKGNQLFPAKVMENVAYVDIETTMDNYGSEVGYDTMSSTAAITKNGDLYMWGNNWIGQIGCGKSGGTVYTPTKILSNISSVQLGLYTIAAISNDQSLYVWGENAGNGSDRYGSTSTPFQVMDDIKCFHIRDLPSCSEGFSQAAALTNSGDLYVWGYNNGTLGNGSTAKYQSTPVKILSNVDTLPSFYSTLAAITQNKDLYMWGSNGHGQVGNGTTENQLTPVKVLSNVSFFSLDCSTSAAVTTDGGLYIWGYNKYAQVGNGTTEDQLTPVKILGNVSSFVSNGLCNNAAITTDGSLYIWGDNWAGQVGNGTTEDQHTPAKVLNNAASVSFYGNATTASVTTDGSLYVWGNNGYGQVGNNTTESQFVPTKVLNNVSSFSPSLYTSAAVTTDGGLYIWGMNEYGQVGNGTTENQLTPYKIEIQAETPDGPDKFNEYIYRADYLIAGRGGIQTPGADITQWESLSPVNRILNSGVDVKTPVALWKAVQAGFKGPSGLMGVPLELEDMYTAVILKTLEVETKCTLLDELKADSKRGQEIISSVKDAYALQYGTIDYMFLSGLTQKEQDNLLKVFKEETKDIDCLKKVAGVFDTILQYADDIATFFELCSTYGKLREISDSTKLVLHEMYDTVIGFQDEKYIYMQKALKRCCDIMDAASEEAFDDEMVQVLAAQAGRRAIEVGLDKLWKAATDIATTVIPGFGLIYAAYNAATLLTDTLFHTEDASKYYLNMGVISEYEYVAASTVYHMQGKYRDHKTEANAKALLEAFALHYKLRSIDCDCAKSFSIALGDNENGRAIENIKKAEEASFDAHLVNWVYGIEEDYPMIYPYYAHLVGDTLPGITDSISSKYTFACPVDVLVYNAADELVGSVAQGRIYASEEVTVTINGEEKSFFLYDNAPYRFVCNGYDTGEMDISITEYANGTAIRQANFYDLAVENEEKYEIIAKENPTDAVSYTVMPEDGKAIPADFDSNTSSGETYALTIQNGYVIAEQDPAFEAKLYANENVRIYAYVPEGYRFVRWETSAGNSCLSNPGGSDTTLRMPEQNLTVTAILEKIAQENPFVDVAEGRFYYKPVLWAVENNITAGMDATHFMPEMGCTRGQVVTFLWRAMGYPEPESGECPFVDVKSGKFYYKAVLWAAEKGITAGMDATHFAPEDTVTRGQFVTFLWRAEGKPAASGSNPFTDVNSGRFYYNAVLWAAQNGVTSGMTPNTFEPDRTCTRGQVVTFLYRDLAE